jgi:predicted small lipoprotein YifL
VPRPDRALTRLALIGALIAAFGLAGCGRRGALDPPPSAAISTPAAGQPANAKPAGQGFDPQGRPIASTGKKKHIFLDWLID